MSNLREHAMLHVCCISVFDYTTGKYMVKLIGTELIAPKRFDVSIAMEILNFSSS